MYLGLPAAIRALSTCRHLQYACETIYATLEGISDWLFDHFSTSTFRKLKWNATNLKLHVIFLTWNEAVKLPAMFSLRTRWNLKIRQTLKILIFSKRKTNGRHIFWGLAEWPFSGRKPPESSQLQIILCGLSETSFQVHVLYVSRLILPRSGLYVHKK